MSEVVQMRVEDGVALLTLNRPDRLNAWTAEMEHAYFAMLEQCAREQEVRVIVVTGAGRGFCAGADMQELQAIGDGTLTATAETHERRPQTFPLSIPKPIIAAVNGACAGIGLVQALMCDMRFAAEGAKLTTAFARRGLVAEHGISWILPQAHRTGPRAGPAALRPRGAGRGGARARPGQPRARAREAARGDARLRARARRQLLAREHGHDEATGLRRPRARAARRARRGRPADASSPSPPPTSWRGSRASSSTATRGSRRWAPSARTRWRSGSLGLPWVRADRG